MDKEIRSYNFDLKLEKREDSESPKIVGHAAVFDEPTNIAGMFMEQVKRGAFKDSIKVDDVRALFNHDANYVLGRNKAGTLRMKEDNTGLAIEIDPPDTQFARDLMVSMERGDISQMSFGFTVDEEKWTAGKDGELDKRDLVKVRLFDVSPVTYPAYEGTDVGLRSHNEFRSAQDKGKDADRKRLNIKRKLMLTLKENGGSK